MCVCVCVWVCVCVCVCEYSGNILTTNNTAEIGDDLFLLRLYLHLSNRFNENTNLTLQQSLM